MNRFFQFITCDGAPVTSSYTLSPVSASVSGSCVVTIDVLPFVGSQTIDLVDNVYEIELDRMAKNEWTVSFSGSTNPTASANIISGSYLTGSFLSDSFKFMDNARAPMSGRAIEFKPLQKKVCFNESFVLEDPVTYTTNSSGSISVNLVPQTYLVTGKGDRKNTCFTITPSGSKFVMGAI